VSKVLLEDETDILSLVNLFGDAFSDRDVICDISSDCDVTEKSSTVLKSLSISEE